MRYSTLDQMVEKLRIEARLSTDSSRGVESRPWLVQLINRWYETLWHDHEWMFLTVKREDATLSLQAGQRYYSLPDELDVDTISNVFVKQSGTWEPVDYGIDHTHYSQHDSDSDSRFDPVQNWTARDLKEIEVWPIPASNGLLLGFEGKRTFNAMVVGSDRCLLDDNLVILFAAAEILTAHKQPDAAKKEQAAGALLGRLKGKGTGNSRVRMGLGKVTDKFRRRGELNVVYERE